MKTLIMIILFGLGFPVHSQEINLSIKIIDNPIFEKKQEDTVDKSLPWYIESEKNLFKKKDNNRDFIYYCLCSNGLIITFSF